MAQSHILGFPRIGHNRQLKKALEAYWDEKISLSELEQTAQEIQRDSWQLQANSGLDYITVDFTYYDHVLETSALLGVVSERFNNHLNKTVDLNTMFCMARGKAPQMKETLACEMTKWFNTNYHYIVPEFSKNQEFCISTEYLFNAIDQAQQLGYRVKPVLLGPVSFLALGKSKELNFNRLALLKKLLPVYQKIIDRLQSKNIEWIQIDEPILVLDLSQEWQAAFTSTYQQLKFEKSRCLLTTYFGDIDKNFACIKDTNIAGIHLDFSKDPQKLLEMAQQIPADKILSAGVISGRNIWKADLSKLLPVLTQAKAILGERLWVGSSCSLLHVPVSLDRETSELKNWLSFAKEKIVEIATLGKILNEGEGKFSQILAANQAAMTSRQTSSLVNDINVKQRLSQLTAEFSVRKNPYKKRALAQKRRLNLPLLPTTTIGSFPQTKEIRTIRQDFKSGKMDEATYVKKIREEIALVISKQEQLDIDVLVHGEAERNDMVEYFGELLNGFAFTKNGWVQSYGSRCVKPPIIYGDVSRPVPMTVNWIQYAQQLTARPVKGMLTGPVTILAWSFVRDDQPLSTTALQIALALRDEVTDLEKSGIKVIQIDEPAFREALPLLKNEWDDYLQWAVTCFRVASCGVEDDTQIHTHMCYSEFNDIIDAIAKLDADVITIENSRSDMELLRAFEHFSYPNEIGPGVFDIHSPRIPNTQEMVARIENIAKFVPMERLWVNPDCGLKTRNWLEVEQALTNMVSAAKVVRRKLPITEMAS